MSQTLNIKSHVTATVIGDFQQLEPSYYGSIKAHPSYEIFCEIYGVTDWKWAAVDTWITFAVIVTLFVLIKNISYFILLKTKLIIDDGARFPLIDLFKQEQEKLRSFK